MFKNQMYFKLVPQWLMTGLMFLLLSQVANAQNKFTISGNIKDASTGEDIIGATVRVLEKPSVGTVSNVYGYYSLTMEEGTYTLQYSFMGYNSIEKKVELTKNLPITINLAVKAEVLGEAVVYGEAENANVTNNEMSIVKITPKDISTIPVLFGEKDVIKVMQLNPGVASAGEGSGGFYVRGGAVDQNLILLDEAPVYNASHLLGFFSVFNSDVIKDVTLYKGGIPAKYGGRASSVMDIKMNDGNNKKLGVSGGIGTISSKIAIEGPIVKNKGSFVISARRTYADLFLKLSKKKELKENQLFFYDLTAKANYQITKKDRVFLSGYFGRDKLKFGKDFAFDWGNKTGTARWNHIYGDRLFSNVSLIFSDYSYKISVTEGNKKLILSSLIRDINLKLDYSFYWNKKNTIEFGGNSIYHKFLPGDLKGDESNSIKLSNKTALESALYIQNNYKATDLLTISYGLRYSHFNYMGPGKAYEFDSNGKVISTTDAKKWKSIQQYHGIEPRINATYLLDEHSSVKASYGRNYQYMHLLSNSTSTQPNDVWVPSSNNIKPLIADQFALGYFRNFNKNQYQVSVEGYYKNFQNQLDYKDGADLFLNETVENQLVFGKGYAYGAEFLIKKTKGKLTGWVGYTYSRSFKKIPEINDGKAYAAKQDRIHDISVVAMYSFTKRFKVAANWVFNTGNAVTFPSGRYTVDNQSIPYYTERNGYRMPNYHRLDIGITLDGKEYKERVNVETNETEKIKKKVFSSWNLSVYNAYARANAYTITFRPKADDPTKTEAVQTTLFKIVPSISYNFKF